MNKYDRTKALGECVTQRTQRNLCDVFSSCHEVQCTAHLLIQAQFFLFLEIHFLCSLPLALSLSISTFLLDCRFLFDRYSQVKPGLNNTLMFTFRFSYQFTRKNQSGKYFITLSVQCRFLRRHRRRPEEEKNGQCYFYVLRMCPSARLDVCVYPAQLTCIFSHRWVINFNMFVIYTHTYIRMPTDISITARRMLEC